MGYSYQLVYLLSWYFLSTMHGGSILAFVMRTNFALSRKFPNYKLTCTQNRYNFIPIYFPKASFSKWDTMKCVEYCSRDSRCSAFNFYENSSFYICEFLEENYCKHRLYKTLVNWPGNSIWEKLSTLNISSCLDKYNNANACATLKPACSGSWPNCNNCARTCKDANLNPSYYSTTLWPYGSNSTPIFAHCYADITIVIKRRVDKLTGLVTLNYTMSFSDISQLYSLKQYTQIRFTFFDINGFATSVSYRTSSISSDGTLMNVLPNLSLTLNPLNFYTGSPRNFSFVVVANDRYNCGSFWLVNSANATYCPGGNISIFGVPKMFNAIMVETGIKSFMVPFYGIDVSLQL